MYRTVTIQYRYLLSASNADGGIITTIEKKQYKSQVERILSITIQELQQNAVFTTHNRV